MDMERIENKVREMLSEMTLNMDEYKTSDSYVCDELENGYINFLHPNGFRILVDFDLNNVDVLVRHTDPLYQKLDGILDGDVQLTEVTLEY